MANSDRRVKGLGEVSIRVRDLEVMQKFYEDTVSLEVLRREESFVFFRVAEGYGGHTQNFALFCSTERSFAENKSREMTPERLPFTLLRSTWRLRISNPRDCASRAWV